MDNGLIFPYRRRTAHAESDDAKRQKQLNPSGECLWIARPESVVSKRINRGDAGR